MFDETIKASIISTKRFSIFRRKEAITKEFGFILQAYALNNYIVTMENISSVENETKVVHIVEKHYQEYSLNLKILLLCGVLVVALNLYLIARIKQQTRPKQSVSKFLLGNQALSDVLVGLVFIPAFIIDTYVQISVINFVSCFVFFNSLFSRCILAYDRYLSINRPFQYQRLMTIRPVKRILLIFLGISSLLAILPLLWIDTSRRVKHEMNRYFAAFLWLVISLMLFFLLIAYLTTFCKTKRFIRSKLSMLKKRPALLLNHSEVMCDNYARKERRLTVQFAVLALCFALTYLPILYINLMGPILQRYEAVSESLLRTSLYTFVANAAFTPVLALMFNTDGKKAVFCCK